MLGSCWNGPIESDHRCVTDCLEVGTHIRNGVGSRRHGGEWVDFVSLGRREREGHESTCMNDG
jgi:hypothetical protein